VGSLGEEFQAIVIFIDDMDRCATDTIVDTFETIRLFLNAPKTAYVVGAHEAIIAAALESRYPARAEGDSKVGRHYLEKMLQVSVSVPPLSEPEALTHISLLYAEHHLGRGSVAFAKIAAAASSHRAANELDVASGQLERVGAAGVHGGAVHRHDALPATDRLPAGRAAPRAGADAPLWPSPSGRVAVSEIGLAICAPRGAKGASVA